MNNAASVHTGSPVTGKTVFKRLRGDLALAVLCLLTFLVPVYRAGYVEDSFILPKVVLVQGCLIVVMAALLARGRTCMQFNWTDGLLLGFLAVNVASVLYANSRPLAIHGVTYLATFVALYFACRLILSDRGAVIAVLVCALGGAVITAIWTLHEDAMRLSGVTSLVPKLPDWRGYLAAGLGNSGHIAGLISLVLPFTIASFLWARRGAAVGLWFCLLLMFAALTVTWSVGSTGSGILALGFCAIVALLSSLRSELKWNRLIWVVAAGLLAVFFYMIPHKLNPHAPSLWTEAFGSERWKEGGPTRLVIWKTTWEVLRHNWLIGIGAGNFTREYVMVTVPSVLNDPHLRTYAGGYTNEAHNEYMQVWTENGIGGLVLYCALFVSFFASIRRSWKGADAQLRILLLACAAGVVVFLLDSIMTFPFRLPAHFAFLALLLAMPPALGGNALPNRSGLFCRGVAAVAMLVLLLCGWVYGSRFLAAWKLKQARGLAESPVMTPQGMLSHWVLADRMFQSGAALVSSGDVGSARSAFDAAKNASTGDPFPAVEQLLRRSLAYDPYYSNASSRLGALLLFQQRAAESRRILEHTLKTLEAYEIHERLGWAYWQQGDVTSAILQWQTCAQRRPQMAKYYDGLIRNAKR